jgi:hypothetical protein
MMVGRGFVVCLVLELVNVIVSILTPRRQNRLKAKRGSQAIRQRT